MPITAALSLAWEDLQNLDLEYVSKSSGFGLSDNSELTGLFLSDSYIINPGQNKVFYSQGGETVNDFFTLLILHYLIGATAAGSVVGSALGYSTGSCKDIPLSGEWISFKELPSGGFYFSAFEQRCIKKLINSFGNNPQDLINAAKRAAANTNLKYSVTDIADSAVSIKVFPKIPVCLAIWAGDEEDGLPPSATVLFDQTSSRFLATEDLSAIANLTISKIDEERISSGN